MKWYEDTNMVDKPIWVRDDLSSKWHIVIFSAYAGEYDFKSTTGTSWMYAKPITSEDLYLEGKYTVDRTQERIAYIKYKLDEKRKVAEALDIYYRLAETDPEAAELLSELKGLTNIKDNNV